jgi:hypothetical protein
MNFWVAVIFFCHSGTCSFWKASEVFDTKAQCERVLVGALETFDAHAEVSSGACLEIKLVRA